MQRPTSSWVAKAAARAEQRLSERFPTHPTPLKQLQSLIDAIMSPRVKRDELRRLARSMSGEGQS